MEQTNKQEQKPLLEELKDDLYDIGKHYMSKWQKDKSKDRRDAKITISAYREIIRIEKDK